MRKDLYKDLYDQEEKHWWHINKRLICSKLINKYRKNGQLKLLDVGCGTGMNVDFLKQFGKVWGLDKSPLAIEFCRKRHLNNIKVVLSDRTGFKPAFFDIVTLLDLLEHTDENKTLKEMNRILKPGGLIVITVPALPRLWSRWDIILHHYRRYTKKSLKSALLKHKFTIIKISYMNSFLLIPIIITRFFKSLLFKDKYTSDFSLSGSGLNNFGQWLGKIEAGIILHWDIPLGTSLICIAKK